MNNTTSKLSMLCLLKKVKTKKKRFNPYAELYFPIVVICDEM